MEQNIKDSKHASVVTLDLEGVLVPEIWIAVAEKTGIEKLRLTTKDVADYDALMRVRLKILAEHELTLSYIQNVISTLAPLEGASAFLKSLRELTQVIILSDTFAEFAKPLMRQLDWPTLFCHNLVVENDRITGYKLRQTDQKREAVRALKSLGFKVYSAGDSYNDTSMLLEADTGILFRCPDNVAKEFPQFPVETGYEGLYNRFSRLVEGK